MFELFLMLKNMLSCLPAVALREGGKAAGGCRTGCALAKCVFFTCLPTGRRKGVVRRCYRDLLKIT